ncbi:response regulator transcription factor [bacterium]|nr:response regulator transcription factor [bacterium]
MNILVVEDIERMREVIVQGLRERGFEVQPAIDGYEAEEFAIKNSYDVIVLDVMLPGRDGLEVCRRLRSEGIRTPVLLLTALTSPSDVVAGFDAGGDDYLTKPFEFSELVARIRALWRRNQIQESTIRFEDIELDLLSRRVKRGGKSVRLTQREYALLEFFVRNPGRILSRTEISQTVWETDFDRESNVIDVYVSMVRRKLEKNFSRKVIHTVVSEGYMLSAPESVSAMQKA